MSEIKAIATILPPVINNDTPSYMVPRDQGDTNDGAIKLWQDHMYGASSSSMVPSSTANLQMIGLEGGMYAFEIYSKSFRDLIEICNQSSENENTLLAAKKTNKPAY